jgi:ferredoxin-NADP reductase
VSAYEARLKQKEEIAANTMAFHFSKPEDFNFKAGQAVDVVLPDASLSDPQSTDPQSGRHTFSIVSAPYEGELVLATRIRDSAFKRAFKSMATGSAVIVEGPFGSLTLHNNRARAAVFIAGGIGITPFMSILRQAALDRSDRQMLLLYSNRRPESAAFLDELHRIEQQSRNFHLVSVITEASLANVPWEQQSGPIDEALIKKSVAELPAPIYYLVGPPGMVESMRSTLNRIGVDDDDIRSEEFYGY